MRKPVTSGTQTDSEYPKQVEEHGEKEGGDPRRAEEAKRAKGRRGNWGKGRKGRARRSHPFSRAAKNSGGGLKRKKTGQRRKRHRKVTTRLAGRKVP